MNNKHKLNFWLFETFNNWRSKDFTLGISLCVESHEMLPDGYDWEVLNTNEEVPFIKFKEYYILFNLGFWQVSLGFRI